MSTSEEHSALRQAATEVLERFDLVLEDLVVRPRSGTTQVRLVVDLPEDRTGSADLDTVAEASSALSELIDADGSLIGSGPSVLEVTTPGVDRALTTARHFRRARGRLVLLRTADGTEHRARVLAVREQSSASAPSSGTAEGEPVIVLRPEPGTDDRGRPRRLPAGTPAQLLIPLAEVASARVQIEFDPPADLDQLIAEADTITTGSEGVDEVDVDPAAAPKES
ncbi:ribosome assembly cofactor RimP [Brachybacterium sp. p3-SID1565]|uniref:Ribosome maturation factor RimP n=1 Tax=Brachybacterium epidermidis TaxID=2781983 RepID=A0ABR9VZM0_9MICO|nr:MULTISPECIES: ribosome assembly cofactor RimP [Brachybacterium]MBE9403631.1 ribosome assembly cofactor RimP [Brachybacterium epidermidis]MCT1385244.1 ribosome assembly cofactor RimP [Brachybacterium sp. p3-SID1565]